MPEQTMDAYFGLDGKERVVSDARPMGLPRKVLARDEARRRAAGERAREHRVRRRECECGQSGCPECYPRGAL